MRKILPGIFTWSWFSEEKKIHFNGHLVEEGNRSVLIDPPPMTFEEKQDLSARQVVAILLTNRDHTREAMEYRSLLNTPIWAPEADGPLMEFVTIDRVFREGEMLPCGLQVVSIVNGKSPGESAFYLAREGGIFILGDALIGKPAGELHFLPADKYPDIQKAKEGVRRLLNYSFEVILVGDGEPVLAGGKKAVEKCLGRT